MGVLQACFDELSPGIDGYLSVVNNSIVNVLIIYQICTKVVKMHILTLLVTCTLCYAMGRVNPFYVIYSAKYKNTREGRMRYGGCYVAAC